MKKGQVSVFIVVGIVALVLIGLIFFFRDSISEAIREKPVDPQKYLTQQLSDIKKEIGRCVNTETSKASKLLMENGGNFERDFSYISYFNIKYPILCREFEDKEGCLSEPILIFNLQSKLNTYLPEEINKCLNLDVFKDKDYDLVLGEMNVSDKIFDNYIIVNVNFPVRLKKDAYIVEENDFVYNLNIPLGSLANAVNDLLEKKASGEEIDPLLYGLLSMNKYNIQVRKPYPDELYDVSLTTNDTYHFYFAIEGNGRYERAGTIR